MAGSRPSLRFKRTARTKLTGRYSAPMSRATQRPMTFRQASRRGSLGPAPRSAEHFHVGGERDDASGGVVADRDGWIAGDKNHRQHRAGAETQVALANAARARLERGDSAAMSQRVGRGLRSLVIRFKETGLGLRHFDEQLSGRSRGAGDFLKLRPAGQRATAIAINIGTEILNSLFAIGGHDDIEDAASATAHFGVGAIERG